MLGVVPPVKTLATLISGKVLPANFPIKPTMIGVPGSGPPASARSKAVMFGFAASATSALRTWLLLALKGIAVVTRGGAPAAAPGNVTDSVKVPPVGEPVIVMT